MAGRRGDMTGQYPHRATMSSMGSLLMDPAPIDDGPKRPPSRHTLSSICLGHSERPQNEAVRGRDGAAAVDFLARSSRKNAESSGQDAEYKFTKGRASVPHHRGEGNPIVNPPTPEQKRPIKQFGRAYEHHGDIIAAPPPSSDENYRPSRNLDAAIERDARARRAHGDIITGANQTLAIGSGKRRSAMADSMANRSTMNLLQWNESQEGAASYPHRSGSPSRNNQSSQMHRIMTEQAPAGLPAGQSAIDRLAIGAAYAVTAPRNATTGHGMASLLK